MARSEAVPPQYFAEQKRVKPITLYQLDTCMSQGEVNELRQLMRMVQADRSDTQKQRETLKKVIAYMTLGIDVSQLFSEVIMACCTNDIVQKKMVYLYLSTYAETNPELALLAVNTLQKDSRDNNPAIRGLALRSLCSLRSPTVVEYLEPAIRRGLVDPSGYVRRTASMGVLKLFQLNPHLVSGRDLPLNTEEEINSACDRMPEDMGSLTLLQFLFKMLNDVDTQVVANVINVLNEILASRGGLPFTRSIIARLLNRIRQFNDWGQCTVLNLLAEYRPSSDEELFDILNILEDRLKHCSSAVVLAATRCFVGLSSHRQDLRSPILARLKGPLLTLVTTASPEISYVVLSHLHHLLQVHHDTEPGSQSLAVSIIEGDTKLFYCTYTDPVYVKLIKLDILLLITSQATAPAVVEELAEYVIADLEAAVVRKAIEVMGHIGIRFPTLGEQVLSQLLTFLELDVPFISTPVLLVTRRFLRSQPELFSSVETVLPRCFPNMTDLESIAAALWILGEFGTQIPEAPYLIEDYLAKLEASTTTHATIDTATPALAEEKTSRALGDMDIVLLELVAACVKLFLQRAPEMQCILGKLFKMILHDDSVTQDVRDRTLQAYRFLQEASSNEAVMEILKQMVLTRDTTALDALLKTQVNQKTKKDFSVSEFNTLALLYKMPPSKFLAVKDPIPFCGTYVPPSRHGTRSQQLNGNVTAPPHAPEQCALASEGDHPGLPLPTISSEDDLLELDSTTSSESPPVTFLPKEHITPAEFETQWTQLPPETPFAATLKTRISQSLPEESKKRELLQLLQRLQHAALQCHLITIAAGVPSPDTAKCFLYGRTSSPPDPCFFEIEANGVSGEVRISVKSTRQDPRSVVRALLAHQDVARLIVCPSSSSSS